MTYVTVARLWRKAWYELHVEFIPKIQWHIHTGIWSLVNWSLADPRGGARDARPPWGPNSFIFMQFSAKMWKIIAILGVGAPPGENPGSATADGAKTLTRPYIRGSWILMRTAVSLEEWPRPWLWSVHMACPVSNIQSRHFECNDAVKLLHFSFWLLTWT